MTSIIILIFVIGYLSITLEHPLKLDKTVPALIMAALIWALLAIGFHAGWFDVIDTHENVFNFLSGGEAAEHGFDNTLLHHLGKTSEILIFLIGAMTIVEIIDLHRGFEILKGAVHTKSKKKLLWIIGILAFILSAIIDNLTATIVLITLLRKLIQNKEQRLWYAAMVVIANKVTALGLVKTVVLPSIVCFIVPFFIAGYLKVFKGNIKADAIKDVAAERLLSSKTMLFLGLGMIVSVPIFKTITHLPPYIGMMLALGVVWLVSEYIHPEEDFPSSKRHLYSAHKALSRIEISSILFFLGILMAVAGLESLVYGVAENGDPVGTLRYLAEVLQAAIPNQDLVVILLGVCSAVIDNVPLVAASIGMYDSPADSILWHFIAYSAGTGGSMLIIGSAAGVAAMGMEKIDFIWYLKKISWLAFAGFIAGAALFILLERVLFA
jgi:Na+/H+ antiporter NhaD/arsenite permease-like protein